MNNSPYKEMWRWVVFRAKECPGVLFEARGGGLILRAQVVNGDLKVTRHTSESNR